MEEKYSKNQYKFKIRYYLRYAIGTELEDEIEISQNDYIKLNKKMSN